MTVVTWIGNVSEATGRIGALIVTPLVLAMVFEVVSRYAFSAPTYWAFEVSYMMMGGIFFFGIAYALKTGAHVNVDFIHARLPRRVASFVDFVSYLVLTGLYIWIVSALTAHVANGIRTGEGSGVSAWNPTIWPYRVVFVVGFATLALQTFAKLVESAMGVIGLAGRNGRA